MGRFDTIKTTIDANIKENGNQEITGQKMNSILTEMVNATDAELTELESNLNIIHGQSHFKDLIKAVYVEEENGFDISSRISFRVNYISYNSYSTNSIGFQTWASIDGGEYALVLNTIYYPKWKPCDRVVGYNDKSIMLDDVALKLKFTLITSDNQIDSYPNSAVQAIFKKSAMVDTRTTPFVLSKIEKTKEMTEQGVVTALEKATEALDKAAKVDVVSSVVLGKYENFTLENNRVYDLYLKDDIFKIGDEISIDITENTSTDNFVVYGNKNGAWTSLAGKGAGWIGHIGFIISSNDFDFIRVMIEENGVLTGTLIWKRQTEDTLAFKVENNETNINRLSEQIPSRKWIESTNILNPNGEVGYLINADGSFGEIGNSPEAWILVKWIRVEGGNQITFGAAGKKGLEEVYNYAFYDKDKKIVSFVSSYRQTIETINVPSNAFYFCATFRNKILIDKMQINKGSEIQPYEPYDSFWVSDSDKHGEEWRFKPLEVGLGFDLFEPNRIYTTCNDITEDVGIAGNRNYAVALFLDHCIALDKHENLRFDLTRRDHFPVYSHFDSYSGGAGWTWNEDNSIVKKTAKSAILNNGQSVSFEHISTRATKNPDAFPKILCIGDSVTEGYLANINKANENLPNAYWQWIKAFFEYDKKQSGNDSKHRSLLLGRRNVANVKASFDDNTLSFRACAEGKGGAKLSEYLRGTSVGGAENHFYDSSVVSENKFSVLYWLDQYRTMDDNGQRLTGTAGQQVVGSDGKTYKIGERVSDVNAWDVCTPTHIIIQLGYNDGNRTGYLEDVIAMADIIQYQIPSCKVAFSLPDCPGTYFPEFYPQYGRDSAERYPLSYFANPAMSSHITFREMNKKLITLDDETNNRYYLPTYFISPTADSAPCRKHNFASWLSSRDENNAFNVQGFAAPNLHPNNHAHAAWGYEMYSWIKYTL